MSEITYNTEQMKTDLLAILNEKYEVTNTSHLRQQVKDKAKIPANDRKGSAILDKIFRDLEEEKFIRQENSVTELTTKGTEAANHKNGYLGYKQDKRKEEKTNKILNRFSKIVPIVTALWAIFKAATQGIMSIDTQFWIGIIMGICLVFFLQCLTKITKFLVARV